LWRQSGLQRGDEIGAMAKALEVFRKNVRQGEELRRERAAAATLEGWETMDRLAGEFIGGHGRRSPALGANDAAEGALSVAQGRTHLTGAGSVAGWRRGHVLAAAFGWPGYEGKLAGQFDAFAGGAGRGFRGAHQRLELAAAFLAFVTIDRHGVFPAVATS
jgi:hypothetical protein